MRLPCPGARLLALVVVTALVHGSAGAADSLTPEETLRGYLQGLKARDFTAAHAYVSKAMLAGKDQEVWVKEGEALVAMCDLKIFSFEVGKARIEGERARVPNVLESQDKCVNALGLTEYELYTLVREDGAWKVDSQILLEPPQVPEWFPKRGKSGGDAAPSVDASSH